jgi:hypothetical protein
MDPWKEFAALEDGRDVVRRWSVLEGKSGTMSEDLRRGCLVEEREKKTRGAFINFALHAAALVIELWRMVRSG